MNKIIDNKKAIQAVVCDIGGFLFPDVWETIFLSTDRHAWFSELPPRSKIESVGKIIWDKYSLDNSPKNDNELEVAEKKFWQSFVRELELNIDKNILIKLSNNIIVEDKKSLSFVKKCSDIGIKIYIVSNNTKFLYKKQWGILKNYKLFDKKNAFLSFEMGCTKTNPPNEMYQKIIESIQIAPRQVLIIDDRLENIQMAKANGFQTFHFEGSRNDYWHLSELVAEKRRGRNDRKKG